VVVPFVVIVPVEVFGIAVPAAAAGGTVQASVPLPLPNVGSEPLGHWSVTIVELAPGPALPVTSCEFPVWPVVLVVATVGSGVVVTWAEREEVSLTTPCKFPNAPVIDAALNPERAASCVAVPLSICCSPRAS
jgi:hypothetical protein